MTVITIVRWLYIIIRCARRVLNFLLLREETVRVQFLIKLIEVTLMRNILISCLFVTCGGGICRQTRRARPVAARL